MSKTERSKDHLINVATKLFAERGLRGVTARDIASEAGVSHSMIFRHFGGLDGLVNAAFQHLSNQVGHTSKVFEPLPDTNMLKTLLDQLTEHKELVHMLIHGLLEQDYRFEDPDHLAFKRLVAGFDKKTAAGELAPDLDNQKLALTAISTTIGWLLIEPRIPDLLCEQELDLQAYRHQALEMLVDVFSKPTP